MARRSLLWLMPSKSSPSELWMPRMLAHVADALVAIACYDAGEGGELQGVPLVNLGSRADAGSLRRGERAVERIIDSGDAGAVLVHYLPFALRYEALWARAGVPVFVHAHGYDLTWDLVRPDAAGVPARFHPPTYAADVVRLSARARILSNSAGSTAKLKAIGVPGSRVDLKYLGVPVGNYVEPASPGNRPDCLFLGRLVDFKGPLETIVAFELAAAGGFAGHLTIAGDGPLRAEVDGARSRSPFKERIRVLGAVDAARGEQLRATHRIFAAHSQLGPRSRQEEALGVAYLEALAAGLPVVSASGGSLPEVVIDGGTGLLVDPGDVRAQADALLRLQADPALWSRLSRAAHADALARFSEVAERAALHRILGLG